MRDNRQSLAADTAGPTGSSAQAGFSLLEVVVALAILSFGLTALAGGIVAGLRSVDRAAEAEYALLMAQSLMAEGKVRAAALPAEETGTLPEGYRWRRTVADFPATSAAGHGLMRVTVAVSPPGGGAPVELTTLALQPQAGQGK